MTPVIEARGITKRFPGVVANDKVNFTLEKGEIHALLGENGAGKSTLMNVIYSLYQPDEGQILLNGNEVRFHSPGDAIRLGIGMVHQHFMLVPVMTVTENIMLGEEETTGQALVSVLVAAVVSATLGALIDGVGSETAIFDPSRIGIAIAFWMIAAGLYLTPYFRNMGKRYGVVLFGAGSGFLLGAVYQLIRSLVMGLSLELPYWPAIGMLVGVVALLRWVNKNKVAAHIREVSHEYSLEVSPDTYIHDLSVGAQQRVEIVKALYRDAQVLILDEPTAVLTPQEADDLFEIMRRLKARGVSIVFITHKLREVLEVADRITVLRRGKVIGTTTPAESTRESLARMMVGRDVILQVIKSEANPQETVVNVENLAVEDDRRHLAVKGVSFEVKAGEIVGIAGVQGNGQSELVQALTGLRPFKAGLVTLLGETMSVITPRLMVDLGAAHIPEDRHKHGLVLTYPVVDNMILTDYYRAPFSRGILLEEANIQEHALRLVQQYDVRTPSIFVPASKLSGGNQQKVIVARELARNPRVIIANQPTRGLDVGSIEFIHQQIVAARDGGAGVLLISAELDEIMSLSDRILVMYKGQLVASVPAAEATREGLGLLMAGIQLDTMPVQGTD